MPELTPSQYLESHIEGLKLLPAQVDYLDNGVWNFGEKRGAGKTFAILCKTLYLALTDPSGFDVYATGSRGAADHALSTLRDNFKMKDGSHRSWRYDKTRLILRLPNGGKIHFDSTKAANRDRWSGFENVRFHTDY